MFASLNFECLGVIYAEAKNKCGTHEELMASVARNEVKKVREGGIDYYMFPRLNFNNSQRIRGEIQVDRARAISNDAFQDISATMHNLTFSDAQSSIAHVLD